MTDCMPPTHTLKSQAQECSGISKITENALKIINKHINEFVIRITKLVVNFIREPEKKRITEKDIIQAHPRIAELYFLDKSYEQRTRIIEIQKILDHFIEKSEGVFEKSTTIDEITFESDNLTDAETEEWGALATEIYHLNNITPRFFIAWSPLKQKMMEGGVIMVNRDSVDYLQICIKNLIMKILTEAEQIRVTSDVRMIQESLIEGLFQDFEDDFWL